MPNIQRIESKKTKIVTYKIRICCGYDVNGKKKVNCSTYKPDQAVSAREQKKEAMRYALELEDKIKNGTNIDGNKISFENYAIEWLERRKNDLCYNTYKSYEMMLRTKITPYFCSYKLAKIKLPIVESFYATLVDTASQSTIQKYAMLLNNMFKSAERWGMIEKNPCNNAVLSKSKKRNDGIKFFTPEQAETFLGSLDIDFELLYKGHSRVDDTGKTYFVSDYFEKRRMPIQLKVFFYIAITCGLRRGEILALHWNDIDFENKKIIISKSASKSENGVTLKEPKTAKSIRSINLPERIIPLLVQYRDQYDAVQANLGDKWLGDGNMFTQADGKLMGLDTPYQRFVSHIERYNEWIKRLNEEHFDGEKKLEELPKIPFHGLRHTCATLLNDMGTNITIISEFLGHAQTSTTMDIYAHSFESQLIQASNNMNTFLEKLEKRTDSHNPRHSFSS